MISIQGVIPALVTPKDVQAAMHHGWMPDWIKAVSAVALLVVLAAGVFYRPVPQSQTESPSTTDNVIGGK